MAKGIYLGKSLEALPPGYTILNYIQSSGTQYIDTGVIGKSGVRVSLDFSVISGDLNDCIVIGCAPASYSPRIYPVATQSGKWAYGYLDWFNSNSAATIGQRYSVDTQLLQNSQSMTVNKSAVVTSTSSNSVDVGINMFLFGANIGGSYQSYGSIRVYSCKIYENSTLVRDFIPCINSSGSIGMYDLVTDTFYGNSGTDTFVVGATITSNQVSVSISKFYLGIDNLARKVVKGYIGDANGVAQKIWPAFLQWLKYNVNNITTYKWKEYTVGSSTVYTWDRYNTTSTTTYSYSDTGSTGTVSATKAGTVYKPAKFTESSGWTFAAVTGSTLTSGSWFATSNSATAKIYYFNSWASESSARYTAVRTTTKNTTYSKGSTKYAAVTSTSSSAYPANGQSGSYWYVKRSGSSTEETAGTLVGEVTSTTSDAYPSNGKSGSNWYVSDGSTTSQEIGSQVGKVESDDPLAYPTNGIHTDGYWYVLVE